MEHMEDPLRDYSPDTQMRGFTRSPFVIAIIIALIVHVVVIGLGSVPWFGLLEKAGLTGLVPATETPETTAEQPEATPEADATNENENNNDTEVETRDENDTNPTAEDAENAEDRLENERDDTDLEVTVPLNP